MKLAITHIDPPELHHNPAFAQGVIAPAGRTLYVGGQNGTDANGELLEGIEAQTAQAMRNLLTVLSAAGTAPEHVVKLTIYLMAGIDGRVGFAASQSVWGGPWRSPYGPGQRAGAQPWGVRDCAFRDPSGNLVRIQEQR